MKNVTFSFQAYSRMKWIKLFTIILFTACTALWSCDNTKEEVEPILQEFHLENSLTVKSKTNDISQMFLNMGVTEIDVKDFSKEIIFKFITGKNFTLNGESINMGDYELSLKNEILSIKGNNKYGVTLVKNMPYIISPNFKGSLESVKDNKIDQEIILLLLFMNELTSSNDSKITYNEKAFRSAAACGFFDTYYVYAVNISKSTTEAELASADIDMSGCSKIGGVDTSCLFDAHMCTSTQAYCCA